MPEQRYYTAAEIAAIYQVTPHAVRAWIKRGQLRAEKLGRAVRISQTALDAFIRPAGPSSEKP